MVHLARTYHHIDPALLSPPLSQRMATKYHLQCRCPYHSMADCRHVNCRLSMQPDSILLEPQNRWGKMHPHESILLLGRTYKHHRHHLRTLPSSSDNTSLENHKYQEIRSRSLIHSWRIRRCHQHRPHGLSILHQARRSDL